jgi:hypothetical protein
MARDAMHLELCSSSSRSGSVESGVDVLAMEVGVDRSKMVAGPWL